MDIRVQRARLILSGTATSGQAALDFPVDTAKAFVRITGLLGPHGAWGVSGSQTQAQNRNWGGLPGFAGSGAVYVSRPAQPAGAGNRTSYDLEVWEYVGASGGPNEFLVKNFETVSLGSGTLSAGAFIGNFDGIQVSGGTEAFYHLLPIFCGAQNSQAGASDWSVWAHAVTIDSFLGAGIVHVERQMGSLGFGFNDASDVRVAVLQLSGSNWSRVQQISGVYPGASGGSALAFPLTSAVDWDHSALFISHTVPSGVVASQIRSMSYGVFPGSDFAATAPPYDGDAFLVLKYLGVVTGNYVYMAHVVSNPAMVVKHVRSDYAETVFGGVWVGTGEARVPAQTHAAAVALASGSIDFDQANRPARSALVVATTHYGAGERTSSAIYNRLLAGYRLSGADAAGIYWDKDNATAIAVDWGAATLSFYTEAATTLSGACSVGAGGACLRSGASTISGVCQVAAGATRALRGAAAVECAVVLAAGVEVPCDWFDPISQGWFSRQAPDWFGAPVAADWYSASGAGWYDEGGAGWFDEHEC